MLLRWCLDEKMVGRFHGVPLLSAECSRPPGKMGKLLLEGDSEKPPYVRRFREPFEDPGIPFGAMVEYYPSCARDQSRFHRFGKTVLPGIFLGYALTAGEFGKEMFWWQTLKNRRTWTPWKSILVESKQKKYRRHKGERIS